ncbi:uncharacterized protein LOC123720248 [Pieris brassicae]|uniref:uncharacterized protein LOC123720248 n=1 Tax=Pieris brassicae TaxID=7116 RepID=UPI001E661F84|nr:uncharacterized protein LOC123720248 [Pieris brassicae]
MSDIEQSACTVVIPTEILLSIFRYLAPKHLATCRLICNRWKQIIDDVSLSDKFWYRCCKSEFPSIFNQVMYKAKAGITWHKIYRSLYLWSKFLEASETVDEFASASNISQEIRDIKVLRDGLVAVHTRDGINYYDLDTLKYSTKCKSIIGSYTSYSENDNFTIYIDISNCLIVVRKRRHPGQESRIIINNVQKFLLNDIRLFYVTHDNEIHMCNLSTNDLQSLFLKKFEEQVMTLGYSNTLNVLTYEREIYSLVDGIFKLQCNIEIVPNMQHILWKYNLLERMDWRVYIQWMYILNHTIQQILLKDMLIIYPYGDVFFVGTTWGVFRIYYKPYVDGEFDLYHSVPIKQYNFAERSDCPVLAMSPIFQIDVVETEDGHIVLVAMPKKIAVLYYTHVFKQSPTWPVLPFMEVQDVTIKSN